MKLFALLLIGVFITPILAVETPHEGTAIFKCTNDVPVGEPAKFLTLEGLPSDHYLRLVGKGARMIRREIPASEPP